MFSQRVFVLDYKLLIMLSISISIAAVFGYLIARLQTAKKYQQVLALKDILQGQNKTLLEAQQILEDEKSDQQALIVKLQVEQATFAERLVSERRHQQEKLQLLDENKRQLKQEFENLAQEILDAKQKTQQQGLDSVMKPFREHLEQFRQKIDAVHVEDSKSRSALKTQIEELHKLNGQMSEDASRLTQALQGSKKAQGNWGELILETVLEQSGLRKDKEYRREVVLHDEEGRRFRPDVIIDLPEGKHVVIDAKVSLNDYSRYINSEDEQERQQALQAHVAAISAHIKGLSQKAYQKLEGLNSPDFVFLFMPIEPAFICAFENNQALFTEAFEQRIVVVTPTTLLATLRTVASLWSLERQNRSSQELAQQAARVYDKLRIVVEGMDKLGKQLQTAQGTYQETWSSLKDGRGNLIAQAQKFVDLGVRVKKPLAKSLLESCELDGLELDHSTELDTL